MRITAKQPQGTPNHVPVAGTCKVSDAVGKVSFIGRAGSEILGRFKNVAASIGSACHSGSVELSPVLKAMKVPPEVGMGAIRFSLGRTTTREEIESTVALLIKAVSQSRS